MAPTNPVPPTAPIPGAGLFQGSGPNDPFKGPGPAVPKPTPVPSPPTKPLSSGNAASASSSFVESEGPQPLMLGLEIENAELSAGETTTMTLSGPAELTDAGALEVTLEWDPAVAEIVTVSPGPWRTGSAALNTRLDADRGPGRVRVGFGTPTGVVGLPSGALARFTVRALVPGQTLFRLSAGAGLGKNGALRPEANAVALSVAP